MFLLFNLFVLFAIQVSGKTHTLTLNNGNKIPVVALGTFAHIDKPHRNTQAVVWAIEAGYRHFDTAAMYLNEEYVGKGLAIAMERGLVTREELFITTKLDPRVSHGDGVLQSILGSLRRLNLDYLDLFLIHVPFNGFNVSIYNDPADIWQDMEKVYRLGLAKSIGVSNYDETLIERVLNKGTVRPAVNEIEVNPTNVNANTVKYCKSQNITVLAYAPLGYSVPRPFRQDVNPPPPPSFKDPLFNRLAKKYRVTPSQILLRYLIDLGLVILPKSLTHSYIKRNIDLFHFKLTEEEMSDINKFNIDESVYDLDSMESLNTLCQYIFKLDWLEVLDRIV